jgi:3-oxoacyl-[acyl-carrier protein] reductase
MAERDFGGLDILVAAAGSAAQNRPVETSDLDAWRQTIEVNLVGAFCSAKAAIPALRRRGGGCMIFVGSGMGHRGAAGRSAYAASKAGLNMLVRVLAQEHIGDSIAANELVPGPVLTAFIAGREEQLRASVGPGEWFKQAEDVVPLALFLATQPLNGPTGQTFSLSRRDL